MYSSYGMSYKIAGASNLPRKIELVHNALYTGKDPELIFNTFLHYAKGTEIQALCIEFVYPVSFKEYPIEERYPLADLLIDYSDLNIDYYIYELNLPRVTTTAMISLYDSASSDLDKFLILMLYLIFKTTYI